MFISNRDRMRMEKDIRELEKKYSDLFWRNKEQHYKLEQASSINIKVEGTPDGKNITVADLIKLLMEKDGVTLVYEKAKVVLEDKE